MGALRSGHPGHHAEAADEAMTQLVQHALIGFRMYDFLCAAVQK